MLLKDLKYKAPEGHINTNNPSPSEPISTAEIQQFKKEVFSSTFYIETKNADDIKINPSLSKETNLVSLDYQSMSL